MNPEAAEKWERGEIDVSREEVMSNKMLVAKNLKSIRGVFGVSQMDVARRIGCSLQSVQNWESGRKLPTMEWLTRLAKVFRVDVAYFFAGGTKTEPEPTGKKRKKK